MLINRQSTRDTIIDAVPCIWTPPPGSWWVGYVPPFPAHPHGATSRLVVLPFLAFEAPYFIFFLKYLLASSLSPLPAVKRGCRVAGVDLKVAGSPVNGLVPLRDLVASL